MIRPFASSAQVHCRGYSLPLQRVITDFGADVPFGQIPKKMQEHHGIVVPISSAQALTQKHATTMRETRVRDDEIPSHSGVKQLIAQMDGTMIPIVATEQKVNEQGNAIDRRKTRQTGYREARLSLVRDVEQESPPQFEATLGSVDEVGAGLLHSAISKGMGRETQIHAVGDGAPWLARQVELQFPEQSSYLLDFYHLSEYLGEASHTCAVEEPEQWLRSQQQLLKHNQSQQVLLALQAYLEPEEVEDNQAPVRAAYRYIDNRADQLDYQGAIAANLPIGSGEIESAHRYVILERLDIPGAWWTIEKAEDFLALRVARENLEWDDYWLERMHCLSSLECHF